MNNESGYITHCLHEIEAKLDWGASNSWTNHDFEKLSRLIQDATQVVLSISTLKRLWGRVAYQNIPALQTLNTIARFAGYDDWRTFKQTGKHVNPVVTQPQPVPVQAPQPARQILPSHNKRQRWYWLFGLVPLVIASYFLVALSEKEAVPPLNAAGFQFAANKIITRGLPNSVIFNYDAAAARTDSVYIVQTWDITRKKLVPKDKHEHSAIYYYPGFFRTKLIADRQIMKTHDLMIATDGWLVLEERDPVPFYFKKDDYIKSDRLEVDRAALQSYNIPLYPQAPKIRFFNMREMGSLMNDNFTFETTLKNDFNEGDNACQRVEVLIQCKDDIIIIPLAAKTCVGDISLYACGREVNSKEADLSGLGCDLTKWTSLKVKSVNKRMTIYVNDKPASTFTFPHDPTGIVGVQYRFNGLAAVKNAQFSSPKAGSFKLF